MSTVRFPAYELKPHADPVDLTLVNGTKEEVIDGLDFVIKTSIFAITFFASIAIGTVSLTAAIVVLAVGATAISFSNLLAECCNDCCDCDDAPSITYTPSRPPLNRRTVYIPPAPPAPAYAPPPPVAAYPSPYVIPGSGHMAGPEIVSRSPSFSQPPSPPAALPGNRGSMPQNHVAPGSGHVVGPAPVSSYQPTYQSPSVPAALPRTLANTPPSHAVVGGGHAVAPAPVPSYQSPRPVQTFSYQSLYQSPSAPAALPGSPGSVLPINVAPGGGHMPGSLPRSAQTPPSSPGHVPVGRGHHQI